ncbi:AfsR/SARP family transcriptional regulator [Pseudonocardia spinosispora]|uniref:AfsR/SARP family transcriptional regulator n=1 Tax=Pseudonocardia spinosispora TaxID=103441 RepID=UPI0007E8DB73|nr:BTAD domain-containing putative transcriptional regulator [Pseudonocardia spinosispora]
MADAVRFQLLGPVRAWVGNREVRTGSPQQRAVLAMLLLHDGRSVALDSIIEMLWGARVPIAAAGTVRTYISRIRSTFAETVEGASNLRLEAYGDGYRLVVDRSAVDIDLFRGYLTRARMDRRCGELVSAARWLQDGLGLWRGCPLSGIDGSTGAFGSTACYFYGRIRWLEQLRSSALEEWLAIEIELGNFARAIEELEEAVAADPYHERMWELLMSAQHSAGRTNDALASFRSVSQRLDDDLGLSPGPGLSALCQRMRIDEVGRDCLRP